jgi:hypothetical protein
VIRIDAAWFAVEPDESFMALLRLQNEAYCLTLQPTKQSLEHQPSSNPQAELPLSRERFSPRVNSGGCLRQPSHLICPQATA